MEAEMLIANIQNIENDVKNPGVVYIMPDGGNIITRKEIAPLIGTSEEFKKHALQAAVNAGYGKYSETVVKENVYKFSKYINKDNAEMVKWAETVIDKIENHYDIDGALACIPAIENLPGIPNLRTYIENNRMRVDYPAYRAIGYFVGSGAIESANKTIVQQRLKRAGMRWGVCGAQALLTLRAKDESKRWYQVEHMIA